jgi:GAF domain-containing protein
MLFGDFFGDYQTGYRFGKVAFDLVNQRGPLRFKARVYECFGSHVVTRLKKLDDGIDLVRRAFETANETGDVNFASFSLKNLLLLRFEKGEPLADLRQEAEDALRFVRTAKFDLCVRAILMQLQLIRSLMGQTYSLGSFNDTHFSEEEFAQTLEGDPMLAFAACSYWGCKLQAHFHAHNYVAALEASEKMDRLIWTQRSYFHLADYHFYGALACAASCSAGEGVARAQCENRLAVHQARLRVWAQNCAESFANRELLVSAEIARIKGRDLDAMDLYKQAIDSAHENGFIQNEAIASELAAAFYKARGFDKIALTHLQDARYCYLRWGADGKVRQLDQLYPELRSEPPAPPDTGMIGTLAEYFDQTAVSKASQAISGELVLDKLIDTLMRTTIEHAGANRGLLILPGLPEQRIEAEAKTACDNVSVCIRQSAVTVFELPISLLRYVVRTKKIVTLNDASAHNPFSEDEYFRRRSPRSVLCLPLVKQRDLIGILYFENHLAPGVFTPGRLAALDLICSHAAISLERIRACSRLKEIMAHPRAEMAREQETYALQRAAQLAEANEAVIGLLDALVVTPDLDRFLGRVITTITGQLGGTSAALRLYDSDSNTWNMEFLFQDGRVMRPSEARFPEELGSLRESQLSSFLQAILVCHPADPEAPFLEDQRLYLLSLGVKKNLLIPLISRDGPIGLLAVRFAEDREFRPDELEFAKALAIQASLAIQLARLGETARQSTILEERSRLADQVHESLAQSFAAISLQLGLAQETFVGKDAGGLSYIQRADDLARFGLAEARRCTLNLRPEVVQDSGLTEALQFLVDRSNIAGRMRCIFRTNFSGQEILPVPFTRDLVQIAQEGISNAVRHARSTTVRVTLRYDPESLCLTITDNKRGGAHACESSELLNIRALAKRLRGTFKMRVGARRGTSISVTVPFVTNIVGDANDADSILQEEG